MFGLEVDAPFEPTVTVPAIAAMLPKFRPVVCDTWIGVTIVASASALTEEDGPAPANAGVAMTKAAAAAVARSAFILLYSHSISRAPDGIPPWNAALARSRDSSRWDRS